MPQNSKSYLAHVRQVGQDKYEPHLLENHLRKVAHKAGEFAAGFAASDWGRLAGLWHDLGKYRPAFQKHIKSSSGYDPEAHISSENNPATRHASTGAVYARKKLGPKGTILAYLIAGHHAGLPDYYKDEAPGIPLSDINKDNDLLDEALQETIPNDILNGIDPSPLKVERSQDLHFLIRMLFSCLVDADFLDTESFMSPEKAIHRGIRGTPDELLRCFDQHMAEFEKGAKETGLNAIRSEILTACRQAAKNEPGVYTLTVPTGAGKTLSSLTFALEHAVASNKNRIVYAIPYTSIIEQTADIFRSIFEPLGEVLIEHHSNIEPKDEKHEQSWSRLATENWDAPLIVTTTVQLFESLYAAKTSRCRKLHNLLNSVIVLDETQLLPVENLNPIRDAIRILSTQYDVTFLLTTATPTGLNRLCDPFGKKLLEGVKSNEIIEDPERYYESLRRVDYEFPDNFESRRTWDEIGQALRQHETVLAVVNTRKDAKHLFEKLPKDNAFHLSARMCAKHRSHVIEKIKQRLKEKEPVRVVSTQLVEAGVDLDFPVVYRALSGLDSIVQAAGRCNREDGLTDENGKSAMGRVIVFVPPDTPPKGALSNAAYSSVSLLSGETSNPQTLHSPDIFNRYFELFFQSIGNHDINKVLDKLNTNAAYCQIQFRTAAARFKMIEDEAMVSVFVDYDEHAKQWLGMLRTAPEKNGWLLRRLQRYTVNIYQHEMKKMLSEGRLEEVARGFFAIAGGGIYDPQLGLLVEEPETGLAVQC